MDSASARRNLILLCRMRVCASAALAAVVAAGGLLPELSAGGAPYLVAAWAACNALTLARLRRPRSVSETEFLAHLLCDMAALTALFFLSGGAGNPFTSLLMIPAVLAAVTLPPSLSRAAAFAASACYTALMVFAPVSGAEHGHAGHGAAGGGFFSLHVTGMWVSFLLLCWMTAWFGARMSGTLKAQADLVAEAERAASLGAFAAAAAHELGTPLSAVAALADGCPPDVAPALREQIRRCRAILSRVAAAGGEPRAEGGELARADRWLDELAEEWRLLRPATRLIMKQDFSGAPGGHVPCLIGEYALRQALMNLLHNAADASPEKVDLHVRAWGGGVDIRVRDYGPGLTPGASFSSDRVGVSAKPEGLGLGLYLSATVIRRIGGALELRQAPGGGAEARVLLPAAGEAATARSRALK